MIDRLGKTKAETVARAILKALKAAKES